MKIIDYFLNKGQNFYKIHLILSVVIFALLIITIILSITITPNVKYVEYARGSDYNFKVLSKNIDQSQKELITRGILRDFVLYVEKYSIPTQIDDVAKSKVFSMASSSVIDQYRKKYMKLFNTKIDKVIDIQTKILNDKVIVPKQIHQIRFIKKEELIDKSNIKEFIANIQYNYNGKKDILNPLGINITHYNATEKLEN